jgi:hypothetical protein
MSAGDRFDTVGWIKQERISFGKDDIRMRSQILKRGKMNSDESVYSDTSVCNAPCIKGMLQVLLTVPAVI